MQACLPAWRWGYDGVMQWWVLYIICSQHAHCVVLPAATRYKKAPYAERQRNLAVC